MLSFRWSRQCRVLLAVAVLLCASTRAPATSLPPIQDHYFGATLFVARTAHAVSPPVAVASLSAYEAVYGRHPDSATDHAYHAARLFFANGGRSLYVSDPRGNTAQHFRDALVASASLPVDLVALPGLAASGIGPSEHRAIAAALAAHADASPNRFGLIDAPQGSDVAALVAFGGAFSSAHAAIYAPWLDVANTGGGGDVAMPASAAVAGVISRIDREQGIFKNPSGVDAALSATIDVRLQQLFTQSDQDLLTPAHVNPLRLFAQGILIWGGRTATADPEWRYINTARFLRHLGFSMRRSLAWITVAPTRPTPANVVTLIGDYLHAWWQRGAMPGSTPTQAYFVQCDEAEDSLRCVVGVAPVRPSEFITLRLDIPYDQRIFASGFEAG